MKISTLAAAALVVSAFVATASAAGDPAAGEKVFKKCMACHMVGENAKNRVGPALNGVVGTTIGSHPEDYKFSDALKTLGAEGKVWDEANLTEWLKAPRKFAPGTKMSFAGLKSDEDIANVIAYLETFQQ